MQHRRAKHPLDSDPWRQQIDLQFLLVALTRLRRSVYLATRVARLKDSLLTRLDEFDRAIPSLKTLRNVAEHFDDYTTGNGRADHIKRHQLQVWALDMKDDGDFVWRWLVHPRLSYSRVV